MIFALAGCTGAANLDGGDGSVEISACGDVAASEQMSSSAKA
jgi:hypothetical protein